MTWQPMQACDRVISVTFSRIVREGSNFASVKTLAMGGDFRGIPTMFRAVERPHDESVRCCCGRRGRRVERNGGHDAGALFWIEFHLLKIAFYVASVELAEDVR